MTVVAPTTADSGPDSGPDAVPGTRQHVPEQPAVVARWLARLRDRVGVPDHEHPRHVRLLGQFCDRHGVSPERLLESWESFEELTVRKRFPGIPVRDPVVLAAESFLVHNGVNIFGDIACMPKSQADLATQGTRFTREG